MKIKLTFFASIVILLAVACQNANSNATELAAKATADSIAAAKVKDSLAAVAAAATAAMDTMKKDTTHMGAMAAQDTTAAGAAATAYTCKMHPEVSGKKGDKCPKCHMALVAKADAKPAKK